jgi:DNA-binding GntR family transcriptional regulator
LASIESGGSLTARAVVSKGGGSVTDLAAARGSMADSVCQRIADDIALGHFTPGTKLDEVMLAERFRVSRTPVREALKQLAVMGLVHCRPNRGSVVAAMSSEQLDQIFEAIGELEASCARHAALRMTPEDGALLLQMQKEGRTAMQDRDFTRYDAANLALHGHIIRCSYNPVLIELATSLRHRVAPFRRTQFRNVERMGESFEEHAVIVEALLAHDAVVAYRQMRSHLQSARTGTSRVAPSWASPRADEQLPVVHSR